MNKVRYLKYILSKRLANKDKVCEYCGKEHNHTYGSGRFCSKECKAKFIGNKKRNAHNPKVKAHLDKLRAEGKIKNNAPYGTWKCKICGYICTTRKLLRKHYIDSHKCLISSKKNTCPYCGKEFENGYKLNGHLRSCKNHPLKEYHDASRKNSTQLAFKKNVNGILIPIWTGKHHSSATKQKMRIHACHYLMNAYPHPCRYNKRAISFFDLLSKEKGWNLQHAENGGEFYTGIGYFVDAYDKTRNIVVEYDEPRHYKDIENNILREKDLKRQQEIIDHLHCEYWRYNEKMNVLWKVN